MGWRWGREWGQQPGQVAVQELRKKKCRAFNLVMNKRGWEKEGFKLEVLKAEVQKVPMVV